MKTLLRILCIILFCSSYIEAQYEFNNRRNLSDKKSISFGYGQAKYNNWLMGISHSYKNFGGGVLIGMYNEPCPEFNPFIYGNKPKTLKPVDCPDALYMGFIGHYRFIRQFALGLGPVIYFGHELTVQFNQEVGRYQPIDESQPIYVYPYLNAIYMDHNFGIEIGCMPLPVFIAMLHYYY